MEEILKVLQARYFEARTALEVESTFMEDVRKRVSATAVRVNSMNNELEELIQCRNVTLKQVSRNEKGENDLKEDTDRIDEHKSHQKDVVDLLETLRQTLQDSEAKVTRLAEAFRGANHELFFAVSEYEGSKLKEVEGALLRSWCALSMAAVPINLPIFLQTRFKGFVWNTAKVEGELRREYLTQKGGK